MERAVLVGLIQQEQTKETVQDYLNELAFLVHTAGGKCIKQFMQALNSPNSKTFVGTGKLIEITGFCKENNIDLIVFDDELSPSQLRNIERITNLRVLDRTNLILDIFAKRAQTAHAKTQVELAQYEYLLPRLTGMWTHLERQRGGIGTRGPGEREIETDRRIIRDIITKLKKKLEKIDKQKATQRKNRSQYVRVALVGYTNVGKSTIMNMLSKSEVFAENKLFATLNTTVRKVVIGNLPFLLSDTVGFIRKLPHHLVESFKSTLDEVVESDILIHVIDVSHPQFEEQISIVEKTLQELKTHDKQRIYVFNKIDNYAYIPKEETDLLPATNYNISLKEWEKTYMAKLNDPCIFISAKNNENLKEFKSLLYKYIRKIHEKRYPYDKFLYPDIDF